MPRSRLLVFLLLFFLAGSWPPSHAFAQKKSPSLQNREQERRSFAIVFARAINAAESNYKKTHDSYATWETLLSTGDFSEAGTKWASDDFPTVKHALYGRGPEVVPGWKLRLLISSNGNAYNVLLEDVNDPKCGYAVFTDERVLVRQGKSVDCGVI